MTLLGTDDVDCLLREADEARSRGDKDREASDRGDKSEPSEGVGL